MPFFLAASAICCVSSTGHRMSCWPASRRRGARILSAKNIGERSRQSSRSVMGLPISHSSFFLRPGSSFSFAVNQLVRGTLLIPVALISHVLYSAIKVRHPRQILLISAILFGFVDLVVLF